MSSSSTSASGRSTAARAVVFALGAGRVQAERDVLRGGLAKHDGVLAMGWASSDRRGYRYLAGAILAVPQPEVFAEEMVNAGLQARASSACPAAAWHSSARRSPSVQATSDREQGGLRVSPCMERIEAPRRASTAWGGRALNACGVAMVALAGWALAGSGAMAVDLDAALSCDTGHIGTVLGGFNQGYAFSGLLELNGVDRYSFGFEDTNHHYLVMTVAGDADLLLCEWPCGQANGLCEGRPACAGINLAFVPESCGVAVNPGGNPGFGPALRGEMWYTMFVYYCWGVACGYPVDGPEVAYVGDIV